MMIKRRINEDFKHVWAINWNGLPEDFSDATEIVLTASVHRKKKQLERGIDYVIEGNLIIVDFTPRFVTVAGIYNLELNYVKPSDGFIDGERRSAVDIDVVQIVTKSSQVTDTGDITSTSEAAFGFQGLSAYEVWLKDNPDKTKEDYFNWLRQPATDAVSLIDDKIEHLDEVIDSSTENEAERVTAENNRKTAEVARISAEAERKANEVERLANEASRASNELIREANEVERLANEATRKTNENERKASELTRQSSEAERNEAERLRVDAEIVREQQEQARQTNTATVITNAENAIVDVNAAKDDYYDVVKPDIISQGDYAKAQGDYAKAQGEAVDGRVTAIEDVTIFGEIEFDYAEGVTDFEIMGVSGSTGELVENQYTRMLFIPVDGKGDYTIKGFVTSGQIVSSGYITTQPIIGESVFMHEFNYSSNINRQLSITDNATFIYIHTNASSSGNPWELSVTKLKEDTILTRVNANSADILELKNLILQNRNAIIALGGTII